MLTILSIFMTKLDDYSIYIQEINDLAFVFV